MPKSRNVTPAVGELRHFPEQHEKMPWSEIESSVGREFSIEQRAEIHDCAIHFFLELDLHRTAASRSETSSFRALVVEHLRGLVEIEDRYIATLRDDKDDSEDDRNRKDAQRRRNNACALLNSEAMVLSAPYASVSPSLCQRTKDGT